MHTEQTEGGVRGTFTQQVGHNFTQARALGIGVLQILMFKRVSGSTTGRCCYMSKALEALKKYVEYMMCSSIVSDLLAKCKASWLVMQS